MKTETVNSKEIKQQIEYIRKTFADSEVAINEASYLNQLLSRTYENLSEENTPFEIFDALSVNRIYSALLNLENYENKTKYLKDLLSSPLDFMEGTQSHSKNILFELEVAGTLRNKFKETYLDEPDIVVPFDDGNVGIACKKIISEQNLEKQLSKGVKQIANNDFQFGIVAINIDNLLPRQAVLNAATHQDALNALHKANQEFIDRNSDMFLKYLEQNRIISVLVVSSTIADIENEKPRFNNISASTIWTTPNLQDEHKQKISKFKPLAGDYK